MYRYPALLVRQTDQASPLVLFAPGARDIDQWAGVPQRKLTESQETVGWQREEDQKRLQELQTFMQDPKNLVQNSLLCAIRSDQAVRFVPSAVASDDYAQEGEDGHPPVAEFGFLEIDNIDLTEMPLLDLLRMFQAQLVERVPDLASRELSAERLRQLRARLARPGIEDLEDSVGVSESQAASSDESGALPVDPDVSTEQDDEVDAEAPEEPIADVAALALAGDEHIEAFFDEVVARIQLLSELPRKEAETLSEFLGFSRSLIQSYLRPLFLVDGQHRLRGALMGAAQRAEAWMADPSNEDALDALMDQYAEDFSKVENAVTQKFDRTLPVSLLLSSSVAEHVFQFVVVNQKATAVPPSLLGTIVSTTLTESELGTVRDRLDSVGISVKEAQAVSLIARDPSSPFFGVVQQGLIGESSAHLKYSVAKDIIAKFSRLQGIKLWGMDQDWGARWKKKYLKDSEVVAGTGLDEKFAAWKTLDGWYPVFCRFFTCVKAHLASDDPSDHNFWGDTRSSNLFNKVSLNFLMADFFQFLYETRQTIDSVDSVDGLVDEWLEEVPDDKFFSREIRLTQKRDSPGIRNNWAKQWENYRKGGQLPQQRVLQRGAS